MNNESKIVASLPNLPISDWDRKYVAILRATSRTLTIVSVGEDIKEAREKAYKDISGLSDDAKRFRDFGEILDMDFGDELILRNHTRVFAAYCDVRTYRIAVQYPPKTVYVGISSTTPMCVKFVRIREGL